MPKGRLAEAQSLAETVGANISAFVARPTDALALAQVQAAPLNSPLLGQDPTQPTRRQIFGVPLHVSSSVTAGTCGRPTEAGTTS